MTDFKNIVLPELTQADVELLRELSNACGVSGNEKEVRKIVRREVTPLADTIEVDALGNLIATKKAKTAEFTRVLISAHMDEVGFCWLRKPTPAFTASALSAGSIRGRWRVKPFSSARSICTASSAPARSI